MDFLSIFAPVFEAAKAAVGTVLPVLAGSVGVAVTAAVKQGTAALDREIPDVWKPIVNAAIGAFLSTLVGGTPVEGAIGATIAKGARDAYKGR